MIFIQTFCGFDVFINNQMIYFPSKKAKELLAILVDKRGGSVTISQLAYMLYEEVPEITAKKNIRVLAHRLRKTLKEHECDPDVMEESDGEIWEVVGNTIDNPEMLREGGC